MAAEMFDFYSLQTLFLTLSFFLCFCFHLYYHLQPNFSPLIPIATSFQAVFVNAALLSIIATIEAHI